MKVFSVTEDVSRFQSLGVDDIDAWTEFALSVDCRSLTALWKPPTVYVRKPKLNRGNFLHITVGLLVADDEAFSKIGEFFEMAGEVLPIPFEGKTLSLLNVTECINCLDREKSQWRDPRRREGLPLKYVFHPNRLDESSIFKIPETCKGEILVLERENDPETEFKAAVEHHRLTGLIFKELWSDEH